MPRSQAQRAPRLDHLIGMRSPSGVGGLGGRMGSSGWADQNQVSRNERESHGQIGERQERSEISEREEEARKIRRLQMMMSMVMSVISQDPNLTVEEASEMAANAKRAALTMFPDKELAYDLIYKPRLQRLMNERFRLQ